MPTRKRPPEPPWQTILKRIDSLEDRVERGVESTRALVEDIRSDDRATLEAVEASRAALEQRIERLENDTRTRDAMIETAVRELRLDVRQLQGDMRQVQGEVKVLQGEVKVLQGDVRGLAAKVEALARIEERVTAIEKRLA